MTLGPNLIFREEKRSIDCLVSEQRQSMKLYLKLQRSSRQSLTKLHPKLGN